MNASLSAWIARFSVVLFVCVYFGGVLSQRIVLTPDSISTLQHNGLNAAKLDQRIIQNLLRNALEFSNRTRRSSPSSEGAHIHPSNATTKHGCPLCENGGTPLGNNRRHNCRCECLPQWQGQQCQHNKEEVGSGIMVVLKDNLFMTARVWELLVILVSHTVNILCSIHIDICCPGLPSSVQATDEVHNFITPLDVRLGQGYPVPLPDEEETLVLLFYVTYFPDNDLCSSSRHAVGFSSSQQSLSNDSYEKSRSSPSCILPQEILWESIRPIKMEIKKAVWDSCEVQLVTLQPGQVEEGPGPPDLANWALSLICGLTVSVVLIGVAVHYLLEVANFSASFAFPRVSICFFESPKLRENDRSWPIYD
ncbi:hypothetical protein CAPTEDRAFT_195776 [Capitella teleta]|uniref:EGF-like domain-containing protein n=1 Tax=Capitella teleta TaxID=283909 RepID=R7THD1_CAPTE|nr:hypothetical protein CAPTEDRAFT_195776 [Capitella teleta]|eukprot:ELT93124.1 hypothetical protein CAPTEDRAFT_195776 [Capitella teleta]